MLVAGDNLPTLFSLNHSQTQPAPHSRPTRVGAFAPWVRDTIGTLVGSVVLLITRRMLPPLYTNFDRRYLGYLIALFRSRFARRWA